VQIGFMNYALPKLAPMPAVGMTQLQIMQMLPLGGKLGASSDIATARAAAAAARAADVTWQVRAEAAMAFYDLYATDRNVDADRHTLRLLGDIEKTAASMYRVGEGRQTDVLKAQVEIARMSADTLRMQSMRRGMQASLSALTSAPESAVILPRLPRFPDSVPALDSLQSEATSRPMLRAAAADVARATAAERLARKEIMPDLQVGVQLAQTRTDMGKERMGSLMIGASLPVYARSRQLQMREEAAAMREMAEADLAAMRADTRARITTAHAALLRARSLTALFRGTVLPQAEAAVASAFSAYRVGTVDFMTLLDAQMTLNKYRQQLNTLVADEGKAWAELEMLVGRQLVDPTATVEDA
jgi:outer membrane protein TolC